MSDKVGLVLSGGGAKGAYHVGVMQAINEIQMPIDMIAGTSIGALNGAVLASAPDIQIGVSRMVEIWRALPRQKPIQINHRAFQLELPSAERLGYIGFLISAGLKLSSPASIAVALTHCNGLLKDDVLTQMMAEYLDIEQLQKSMPLYVSIFPQQHDGGLLKDFLNGVQDAFKTGILGKDSRLSEFRHIQSLSIQEQKEFILASAALPLLFKAHQDESGRRFTDGGQGGMLKSQGNTPIQPLIDAGCKHIIVVHLDGASLWHRHDFKDVSIIEIRPSIDMGGAKAMLDFSENYIQKLISTGYQDAKIALSKIQTSLNSLYDMRKSTEQLNIVFDNTQANKLKYAMARLRAKN